MELSETAAILDAILNFSNAQRYKECTRQILKEYIRGYQNQSTKILCIKFPGSAQKVDLAAGLHHSVGLNPYTVRYLKINNNIYTINMTMFEEFVYHVICTGRLIAL